jgi:hypothetical protein
VGAARAHLARWLTAALAALSFTACIGVIGDRLSPDEPSGEPVRLVSGRFSRLSHAEWEQTVVDLFHLGARTGLSDTFAPDPLGGKVFDNNQSALAVNPVLFGDYQTAAETLAERVTSDAALLAGILPKEPSTDPEARELAFLETFGLRAFRRPLSPAEVNARRGLFEEGAARYPALDPFVAGVRISIAAFLQSPHFVYRTLLGAGPSKDDVQPLSDWEIASRLSYAVWNSMPDDELFRAAKASELSTAQGVHAQLERMLDDPRAHTTIQSFFDQLYNGDQYQSLSKSTVVYPDFVPEIGADMRTELGKFTADVFEKGGGVRELFTSTITFVTPRLAAVYGIGADLLPPPDADGFSRVDLDPAERSGLLTRPGFLAWKGKEAQPNTIQRGVFIVRKIICQPLGDPPKEAQNAMFGAQPTNRGRVDALTGPGTCGAGCHGRYINPAGFAFEHYGALGEYRTMDEDHPIDSSASFPFEHGSIAYADAVEFSRVLAESTQAHACLSGYLLQWLLGRDRVDSDRAVSANLADRSLAGVSLRDLMVSALESDLLRYPLITTEVL